MSSYCVKVKTLDSMFYDKLGIIIRNERQKQKIPLMKLSKMTGILRVQLEYYELGYTRIKDETWKIICKALDMNPQLKVSITLNGM